MFRVGGTMDLVAAEAIANDALYVFEDKGSFFLCMTVQTHLLRAFGADFTLVCLVARATAHAAAAQLVTKRPVLYGAVFGVTTETCAIKGVSQQSDVRFFVLVHVVAI